MKLIILLSVTTLLVKCLEIDVSKIQDTPQSWSQWSCVGGTWTRTRSVTQQDGRCYGEDRTHCTPGPCEERGECCRDNSVCNVAIRAGGWITCTCLDGKWEKCSNIANDQNK